MSMGLTEAIGSMIEWIAMGVEMLAVAVILAGVVVGTAHYFVHPGQPADLRSYRHRLGRTLSTGLELLVAADVVRTIAFERTMVSVALLGLLVFIRTFLSWSLVVELEERLPWRKAEKPNNAGASGRFDDTTPGE